MSPPAEWLYEVPRKYRVADVTGPTGPAGPPGPMGNAGATGPPGPTGNAGATGPPGPIGIGATGPAGPPGATGNIGSQGNPGTQGSTGPAGIQGSQGNPGSTGPAGPPGPTGNTGPPGPQGNPGSTGPIGATGAIGPTGPAGSDPRLSILVLGAQHSIASATATEVTGLRATLSPGTYVFKYFLIVRSTATGTGLKFGINYTGTTTRIVQILRYVSTGTAATTGVAEDAVANLTGAIVEGSAARSLTTSMPNLGPYTGVAAANVDILNIIEGTVVVSTAGDLQLWHGSEAAVATSIEIGSSLLLTKVG